MLPIKVSKKESKNIDQVKLEIEGLQQEIEMRRIEYHTNDAPSISDEMYDSLVKRLMYLEDKYTEYKKKTSPSQKIGGEVLVNFQKVKHEIAQWSYDNVFSFEELGVWQKRNINYLIKEKGVNIKDDNLNYFTELKIDGLKVILKYEDGKLTQASTRGDGDVGEDITENIKTFKNIPFNIKEKSKLYIVGEVWIGKKDFDKINEDRRKDDLEEYKNPRNLAAGTLRQLDSSEVAKRNLQYFAYHIDGDMEKLKIKTQSDINDKLKSFGFMVNNESKLCKNLDEIQKYYQKWNNDKRYTQDYGIDGIVIKVNDLNLLSWLGYTAKSPRGGVAYKFAAEEGVAKVLAITYQVGRTGVVTPVAELTPTELAGSTVKRATLHNFDEIQRLDVRLGDSVAVRKAGDIIPQIFDVFINLRPKDAKKVEMIQKCPVCYSNLEKVDVKIVCRNINCKAKKINKIIYFASRKCMNIEGLGESTVEAFYELDIIKSISDIYKLKNKKEEIFEIEGWKEKSVNNLLSAIEARKEVSLDTFITALSIDAVGEESARDIAKYFASLDKFMLSTKDDLLKIYGIGDKVADSVIEFLDDKENQKEIKELTKYINVKDFIDNDNVGKFSDMRFVITGTFENMPREQIEAMVRENGGKVQSAISKSTSILIVGEDAGSKLEKAKKENVKIVSIEEFLKLI